MLRNLFKPFTALGTYLSRKRRQDPFLYARVTTALLYFGAMFVVITTVNIVLDIVITDIITDAFKNPGTVTPEEMIARMNQARWVSRSINIVVFTSLVYLLLGHTLRPIQQLVQSQKQFIANVSHELKTPLTVATTQLEVALRKPDTLTREAALELLAETKERIDHLSGIVKFFLVISDFTAKHPSSSEALVSLEAMVRTVTEHGSEMARERGVAIQTRVDTDRTTVRGNPTALEKMLLNLVRNAVAHSKSGGTVRIHLSTQAGKLVLSVADTGSGIPEADRSRIFEPFYRGSNAVQGGSGLGLAIVQEVASIHDATLSFESKEGVGTTFMLHFKDATAG